MWWTWLACTPAPPPPEPPPPIPVWEVSLDAAGGLHDVVAWPGAPPTPPRGPTGWERRVRRPTERALWIADRTGRASWVAEQQEEGWLDLQALPGTPPPSLPTIPVSLLPDLVAGRPLRIPATLRLLQEAVPVTVVVDRDAVWIEGLPDGGTGWVPSRDPRSVEGLPFPARLSWDGVLDATLDHRADGLELLPVVTVADRADLRRAASARCPEPTSVTIPLRAGAVDWTLRYRLEGQAPSDQALVDPDGGTHPFTTQARSTGQGVLQFGDVGLTVPGLPDGSRAWHALGLAASEQQQCWIATPAGVDPCRFDPPTVRRDACTPAHPPQSPAGPPQRFPDDVGTVRDGALLRRSPNAAIEVEGTTWILPAAMLQPRMSEARGLVLADRGGRPAWLALPPPNRGSDARAPRWVWSLGAAEPAHPRIWPEDTLRALGRGERPEIPFVATARLADLELRITGASAQARSVEGLDGVAVDVSILETMDGWTVDLRGPGGVASFAGVARLGPDGGLAVGLSPGELATRAELLDQLEGRCVLDPDRSAASFGLGGDHVLELPGGPGAPVLLDGARVSIELTSRAPRFARPPMQPDLGPGTGVLTLTIAPERWDPELDHRTATAGGLWRVAPFVTACSYQGFSCELSPRSRTAPCDPVPPATDR